MYIKKHKRGVTLFELLGAVALSGLVAMLISAITLFVSRGTTIVSENSSTTKTSSDLSLLILNNLTNLTISGSTNTLTNNSYTHSSTSTEAVTFSSNKQFQYVDTNNDGINEFIEVTPTSDLWDGAVTIAYQIDFTRNAVKVIQTLKDGTQTEGFFDFKDSVIDTDPSKSYIKLTEDGNSYLLEVKVDYKPNSAQSYRTYYSSIHVNKVN